MSVVHDRMHRWLEVLDDDFIDEDYQEIQVGNQSQTITNHLCTVRGKYQGRAIVAIFAEYFNTASALSMHPVFVRNMLDLFVADEAIRFEGIVRRRGFGDKLLGLFGVKRGVRPCEHALYQAAVVQPEEPTADASAFGNPAFCAQVLSYVGDPRIWKIEFQKGSGISSYYQMKAEQLDTQFFTTRVDHCIAMLSARG